MWLCIDDIPWLVRWLADELRSGGVLVPTTDPLDALTFNCDAENVHIRWDFGGAWEAIVLEGANRGHKFKCSVSEFDARKWQAIGGDAKYSTDFGRASPEQKKEASFFYLQKHMTDFVASSDSQDSLA